MELDNQRSSDNVEDRRGIGMGVGGFGIGGVVIAIIAAFMGYDPRDVLNVVNQVEEQAPQAQTREAPRGTPSDEMGRFVSRIRGSTEVVWKDTFEQAGQRYRTPTLVMFSGATRADQCGMAQSAMGPFYCPPDKQIFLDTGFFREVETRFRGCSGKSACNFTTAYIIAHEAGHHIQNLLGIIPRVTRLQQQAGSKAEANALQVKVELQADCLSGVWVNREAKKRPNFLEPGDIDAALTTASAIGDDTLQRQSTGRVVPDSFTHGSAAQRKQWFMTGYQQGTVQACNTFAQGAL